ncbi:hypothetical protein BDV41DRAFT_538917 [Aspergillus transmontanensis]|uniref:Uncharacterized protein n=1 Tax=Aspergillus transmontanensis TaxID=1034304 RepID=A0A5N6VUX5_9EURO|nr:hypothetical protein BDV41DRAFT_538917 [Aspergillus transmontanensis]
MTKRVLEMGDQSIGLHRHCRGRRRPLRGDLHLYSQLAWPYHVLLGTLIVVAVI